MLLSKVVGVYVPILCICVYVQNTQLPAKYERSIRSISGDPQPSCFIPRWHWAAVHAQQNEFFLSTTIRALVSSVCIFHECATLW